jgi:hypothetical protein
MDDQYCPALLALSQVFHRGGGAHDGGDGGGGGGGDGGGSGGGGDGGMIGQQRVPNANAEQTTATMCENGEDNSKYADFNDDDGSEGNSRTIRSK